MAQFRLLPIVSGLSLALPMAAQADVTANDVLTNMLAPARAFGFNVSVEPVREGRIVYATKLSFTYALPMGLGEVRLRPDDMILDEQGDGSVAIRYSEPFEMKIDVTTPDQGQVLYAVVNYKGFNTPTIASGTPGRITYESGFDAARFEMTNIFIADEPDVDLSIEGVFSGSSRYEITEGDVVRMSMSGATDSVRFVSRSRDPAGWLSIGEQTLTGGTSDMELAIPVGKMDLMNLAEALRAGLELRVSARDSRVEGRGDTEAAEFSMEQVTSYTMEQYYLSLSEAGLVLEADIRDIGFEFMIPPDLLFPIAGTMERSEAKVVLPVTKTDGAVPFDYRITMEGFSLGEAVWALFDPEQRLPRDPMTLVVDVSGEASLLRDPLDILRMMEVGLDEEALGNVETLMLDELIMQATGAELTGSGGFILNNEDFKTFPGIPAPAGSVDLRMTGANALLDRLVSMGLLPEDQAMGARMMMGLFGQAGEGNDEITSNIEVTEDGQVLANGQRIR